MRTERLYNPFYPWTVDLLQRLLKGGHKWFVRQSFPRGKANESEEVKLVFIISHYNDLHQAEAHFSSIRQDPYAYFYDIGHPEQKARLIKTLDVYPEYRFFSNVTALDWEPRLRRYEPTFRSYIENVLKWSPKGKETVYAGLHSKFGQLYITLTYQKQKVRVTLAEIENHNLCATTSHFLLQLSLLPSTSLS